MSNKLPNKKSKLLRLAIKDARALAKSKKYVLNMYKWHQPLEGTGKCSVCLAGAVMANSLKLKPNTYATPGYFKREYEDLDTEHKLLIINKLRTGSVSYDGTDPDRQEAIQKFSNLIMSKYSDKLGRAPWKVYEKGAAILEEVGL